jgi:3-dehydroquinate synthase
MAMFNIKSAQSFVPSAQALCEELEITFKEKKVALTLGKGIIFNESFINKIKCISKNIVVITDSNVNKLYGNKLKFFLLENDLNPLVIEIPVGEEYKSRKTKEDIEDQMLKNNFTKDSALIALGGGVVSDIAAFVSSTYYRGIPLIIIPTSLLAMVDAAIGGKSGLNTPHGKNLIGSFYQPNLIFIDTNFLETLPRKEWLNGFSEVIKYSLISDEELFNNLYNSNDKLNIQSLIYRCCLIKKEIVEKDEKENNIRAILNFGHSIGHCIELLENYKIAHGEAISIGMIFASYLSMREKYLTMKEFLKIFSIFKKYNYPLVFSEKVTWKKLMGSLMYDKKANRHIPRFVLLEKIGKVKSDKEKYLYEVDEHNLKESLIWLYKRFISKKEIFSCQQ